MTRLPRNVRQLIVEAGLAAANHGLPYEAESVRAALPHLVADDGMRRILEASLLLGLGREEEAMVLLEGDESDEAAVLRRLVGHTRESVCERRTNMETQAVVVGMSRLLPEKAPATAAPAEMDAFARAMATPGVPLPENVAVGRLQDKTLEVGQALAGARGEVAVDPAGMLAAQTAMAKSLIEVDLMAKAAGSLSQGINKLVNMQ